MDTILSQCTSGGCGAKIGPGELSGILKGIPANKNKELLVGFDNSDDAAVYRLDDKQSLIATVDFFSPMVEDGETFGRIAAANALSDVYAMGGRPVLALNLICFPEQLPLELLGQILQGGAEKIAEAGAVLGGGHSIYDKEPKYGLAVNGLVDTDKIIRNNTPCQGDELILTKPIGIGIILAAARGEEAAPEATLLALQTMERLNRYAAEKMQGYHVNACTDITGFGLLAHLLEMCGESVTAEIYPENLPILPFAKEYAQAYLLTAAGQRNRNYFAGKGGVVEALPFAMQELLFDPQTSGGLLMSVPKEEAGLLLAEIQKDDPAARIVGRILPRQEKKVVFGG